MKNMSPKISNKKQLFKVFTGDGIWTVFYWYFHWKSLKNFFLFPIIIWDLSFNRQQLINNLTLLINHTYTGTIYQILALNMKIITR